MDLTTLDIPPTSNEMIETYKVYYKSFKFDALHISNNNFTNYISQYLDMLLELCKYPQHINQMRAAIGILSLHRFGYHNFQNLVKLFDRIIPQIDYEFVKFTSWVAGQLIHHPDLQESRYVQHLLVRLFEWTNSSGRRSRQLAAVELLASLSLNAGNYVVTFFPSLQIFIWRLVSHPSLQILKGTANAIQAYTNALMRYGRAELDHIMRFFVSLCLKLLNFDDPIKEYASLLLLEALINSNPTYFINEIVHITKVIFENFEESSILVQGQTYVVLTCFSQVDAQYFLDFIADEIFEMTENLIYEFPESISKSLCMMCKTVPQFIEERLDQYINFAKSIFEDETDSSFRLLSSAVDAFGSEKILPSLKNFDYMSKPFDQCFVNFIVKLFRNCKIQSVHRAHLIKKSSCRITKSPSKFSDEPDKNDSSYSFYDSFITISKQISQKLINELKENQIYAIQLISKVPRKSLHSSKQLLSILWDLTNDEDYRIRKSIPDAIFNLCQQKRKTFTIQETSKKLLQIAIFEANGDVRCSILKALLENVIEDHASPEFMKFYHIFLKDENFQVRELMVNFIAKICKFNPVPLSSMIREVLVDNFFIIRHVPQIHKQAISMRLFPSLIKAVSLTIKAFSKGFVDIITTYLKEYTPKQTYENFLEEDSQVSILISIVESLTLLASLDSTEVSKNSEFLIPKLCDIAMVTEHRKISLGIFHLLFVLLTPPASTLVIRAQIPIILSKCTDYLVKTHSRKARMAILKVLGAIGVPEVHQRQVSTGTHVPSNMNDNLARLFFQPNRDSEPGTVDYAILLSKNGVEQYFQCFTATALMEVFSDDSMKMYYEETIRALVDILIKPKMYLLSYFDSFADRFLNVLEESTDEEVKVYIPQFSRLVSLSNQNSLPFVERSLNFINRRFCDELSLCFLDLIIVFLNSIRDAFSAYASDTVCLLVGCLDDKKYTDVNICKRVLSAFAMIGVFASDLLYLIIPQVSEVIVCKSTLVDVKVSALQTLTYLVSYVDLRSYLGSISRALTFSIFYPSDNRNSNSEIRAAGFALFNHILMTQGKAFLYNAGPLVNNIKKKGLDTPELNKLIDDVRNSSTYDCFCPMDPNITSPVDYFLQNHELQFQNQKNLFFSEETIVSRACSSAAIGVGHQLEQWLRSFMLLFISNSPSPSIRACSVLATSYYPLAVQVFNAAFLSCWYSLSDNAKSQVTKFLNEILFSSENYDTILSEIFNLIIFMDKIEQPLNIPKSDLIKSAMRYGNYAYALKLQQEVFEKTPDNLHCINTMIDIFVQLGQWDDACGIWRKCQAMSASLKRGDVLAHLKLWDQAEPVFNEQFKLSKNFQAFMGLAQSLASLTKWNELIDHFDEFDALETAQKRQIAPFFAEAALHLNKWDQLKKVLWFSPNDSVRCQILKALLLLHEQNYDALSSLINNTFSLIASRPISYWAENQLVHRDIVLQCQELIELEEMKNWLINEDQRDVIEEVWNERLKTMPHDFDLWISIIQNRVRVANLRPDSLMTLFQLKSVTLGTKLLVNAFDILYPNFKYEEAPDPIKLCRVIAEWNEGTNKEKAIEEMLRLTVSPNSLASFHSNYFYASWIMDESMNDVANNDGINSLSIHENLNSSHTLNILKMAYEHLSVSISLINDNTIRKFNQGETPHFVKTQRLIFPSQIYKELVMHNSQIEMLRLWSLINSTLITYEPYNRVKYAVNAISALSRCANLSPSFPDIVLLLNLFFENADCVAIFEQTNQYVKGLSVKLLLQTSPQILVQLSHNSKHVRDFVHNLVFDLLLEHYHGLIFSLIVTSSSKNSTRASSARSILEQLKKKRPDISEEVKLIRNGLLRAAVTWSEAILQKISESFEFFQRKNIDKVIEILSSILTLVSKPRCEMHNEFLNQYSKNIAILQQIITSYNKFNENINSSSGSLTGSRGKLHISNANINQLSQWCKTMQESLTEDIKNIRTIQLTSISEALGKKTDFMLAVFGSYKPNKPVNRIKYFVGQFSVYMTKQQPKDVIVKGEDGVFYQYLLKGHEDLRLDERIQQFFRLINSLLLKETVFSANLIQTVNIIPLSISHGLVQWATGTDTLRAIVEQYRRIHGVDTMMEYTLADELADLAGYDYLPGIQKYYIMERIYSECPDDDLARFFWLKTTNPNAESWLKRTLTFAISTAMMSIVGYVIGLGDRHPSNLLIDRTTGKVVHIDFGDCFEKAMRRKYLPEIVPFRLTRQLVKALGAGGVNGTFRASFVSMSKVLRNNRNVLETVLAIFVHEPLSSIEDLDYDDLNNESNFSSVTSSSDQSGDHHNNNECNNENIKLKKNKSVHFANDNINHEQNDNQHNNDHNTNNLSKRSIVSNSDGMTSSIKALKSDEKKKLSSVVQMRIRIRKKLTGEDFEDGKFLSVEEQATLLIESATSKYNLSKMYSGWCPFW